MRAMRTVLAELAEQLATTDRTLRRAVEEGLIHGHRPSPRTLELPVAERVYLRANWEVLSRLRAALRTEPGVSFAVLFGSRARGDHRPRSDVDLLVRLKDPARRLRVAERLGSRLGLVVQVVLLEDAQRAPLLLEEVMREGRVLVDRDDTWTSLVKRRDDIRRAAAKERRRIDAAFAATFGLHEAA